MLRAWRARSCHSCAPGRGRPRGRRRPAAAASWRRGHHPPERVRGPCSEQQPLLRCHCGSVRLKPCFHAPQRRWTGGLQCANTCNNCHRQPKYNVWLQPGCRRPARAGGPSPTGRAAPDTLHFGPCFTPRPSWRSVTRAGCHGQATARSPSAIPRRQAPRSQDSDGSHDRVLAGFVRSAADLPRAVFPLRGEARIEYWRQP